MRQAHCLRAIVSLADYIERGIELQEGTQSPPHDLMVIGDQNANPDISALRSRW